MHESAPPTDILILDLDKDFLIVSLRWCPLSSRLVRDLLWEPSSRTYTPVTSGPPTSFPVSVRSSLLRFRPSDRPGPGPETRTLTVRFHPRSHFSSPTGSTFKSSVLPLSVPSIIPTNDERHCDRDSFCWGRQTGHVNPPVSPVT